MLSFLTISKFVVSQELLFVTDVKFSRVIHKRLGNCAHIYIILFVKRILFAYDPIEYELFLKTVLFDT